MQTIHAVAHNARILLSQPVDWNPQSGAIWLAGFVVIVALALASLAVAGEIARE